ncbi:S-methyl-5-thioribose kinase [Streptomyces sp. NPDC001728]|uniref:S-methyl-5-thioribose kinase n=1 Tax=Streptomyces sp. NPDC001728 TaxID=3154396 RepID=UPI003324E951
MNIQAPPRLFDEYTLPAYLGSVPSVAALLGGRPDSWQAKEIGDGNVNYVFEVTGPAGRVCVKQAMPYVRVSGASWPLTPLRARYEYRALQEHGGVVPERVPRVLHYDSGMSLLVTEFLTPHIVLRQGLLQGTHYPRLAGQLAHYLARSLFLTSDLACAAPRKRALVAEFSGNTEMTRIMEDMIFTEIYHDHHRNRWTSPHLDTTVERLRKDAALKIAVSRLKLRYLTGADALLHGDLHTGSILVTEDDTRVIDQEFAVHGPMGFDIGSLFAHLLLAYFALDAHGSGVAASPVRRTEQQEWLLRVVDDVWQGFASGFTTLWEQADQGDAYPRALFADTRGLRAERERYLNAVLADTIGFCGAEIIRRIIGMAHVAELESISSDEDRAACELRCLRLATDLLTRPAAYREPGALTSAAGALR